MTFITLYFSTIQKVRAQRTYNLIQISSKTLKRTLAIMAFSLRQRERVDYKVLNSGENLPKVRKHQLTVSQLLPDSYNVERILWKKQDKNRVSIIVYYVYYNYMRVIV